MKKLFALYIIMLMAFMAKAQSHISTGKYACQLVPKSMGYEKYPCPACAKIAEQKRLAEIEKDKHVYKKSVEDAKKSRLASIEASKKMEKEVAEKNKVTEVRVVMPKNTAVKNNTPVKKGLIEKTDKAILKVTGNMKGFKNEKDEVLFENSGWTTYSFQDVSMTKNALQNFGIVDVRTGGGSGKFGEFRADVINSKGEYLFNDNNIKFICHINDGWLLIGSYNSKNYYIYNLLTKRKVDFTSISQYDSEFGRYVWGPAIDFFLPIFSDDIELNDKNYSVQLNGKTSESGWIKKHLRKLFPTQISNEFLSKQSFAFIHTNTLATYLAHDSNYNFELNYNGTDTIMLYGVTKDGKVTTIKLK